MRPAKEVIEDALLVVRPSIRVSSLERSLDSSFNLSLRIESAPERAVTSSDNPLALRVIWSWRSESALVRSVTSWPNAGRRLVSGIHLAHAASQARMLPCCKSFGWAFTLVRLLRSSWVGIHRVPSNWSKSPVARPYRFTSEREPRETSSPTEVLETGSHLDSVEFHLRKSLLLGAASETSSLSERVSATDWKSETIPSPTSFRIPRRAGMTSTSPRSFSLYWRRRRGRGYHSLLVAL